MSSSFARELTAKLLAAKEKSFRRPKDGRNGTSGGSSDTTTRQDHSQQKQQRPSLKKSLSFRKSLRGSLKSTVIKIGGGGGGHQLTPQDQLLSPETSSSNNNNSCWDNMRQQTPMLSLSSSQCITAKKDYIHQSIRLAGGILKKPYNDWPISKTSTPSSRNPSTSAPLIDSLVSRIS